MIYGVNLQKKEWNRFKDKYQAHDPQTLRLYWLEGVHPVAPLLKIRQLRRRCYQKGENPDTNMGILVNIQGNWNVIRSIKDVLYCLPLSVLTFCNDIHIPPFGAYKWKRSNWTKYKTIKTLIYIHWSDIQTCPSYLISKDQVTCILANYTYSRKSPELVSYDLRLMKDMSRTALVAKVSDIWSVIRFIDGKIRFVPLVQHLGNTVHLDLSGLPDKAPIHVFEWMIANKHYWNAIQVSISRNWYRISTILRHNPQFEYF